MLQNKKIVISGPQRLIEVEKSEEEPKALEGTTKRSYMKENGTYNFLVIQQIT